MTSTPNPNKPRKKKGRDRKKRRNDDFLEGTVGQHQIDAWNGLSPEERAWISDQQKAAGKQWIPPSNPARTPKQAGTPEKPGRGTSRRTDNGTQA